MPKGEQPNSVIGEGSIFEGKFYIAGSLKIDGKFEGDIKTENTLIIGESGKVKTNISARNVIVSGVLIGDIHAREEVRITETGKVLGDIYTPVLHLSKGVMLKGNVHITGGQKKDVQKVILEQFGPSKELDKKGIPA